MEMYIGMAALCLIVLVICSGDSGQGHYRCVKCGGKFRKDYFYCGANNAYFCINPKCQRYEVKAEVYKDANNGEIERCIK